MPAYFSDTPTLADRRATRKATVTRRKREKVIAKLKAGARPSRKSAPQKKPRSKKETERIYGPKGFRDYLHAHPCLGCGYFRVGHIEQAHVQTGGMSRKDDWTRTGPLCGPHHDCVEGGAWGPVEGCHAKQGARKRSWRTQDGQTFAAAQREFFTEFSAGAFGGGGREGR